MGGVAAAAAETDDRKDTASDIASEAPGGIEDSLVVAAGIMAGRMAGA